MTVKQTATMLAGLGLALLLGNGTATASSRWVACGDDQLRFYEIRDDVIHETERFTWSELDIDEAFEEARDLDGIVECKPVKGGREILVTSWKGDVARVDVEKRAVNFAAHVPHAHSAEVLPGGRIVALGNALRVFDERNGKTALFDMPVDDGHGIVWSSDKQVLYVLSEEYIEEFALKGWDGATPELDPLRMTRLPGQGDGHDLAMTPEGMFLVSTRDGAWHFDPADRQFTPHRDLHPLFRPQSLAQADGRLLWIVAEESWWGRGFFVKESGRDARRFDTPGIRLYKVRNMPQ